MEEVKVCPNCEANVEGLIYRCDCCGALLYPKNTLFSRMSYTTGACHNIDVFLNPIFDRLDQIDPAPYSDILERIEFDFWCYGPVDRTNWKTKVTHYTSQKRVIISIKLDVDAYVYGTKEEKWDLLTNEILTNMETLRKRLEKKHIHMDDLFLKVSEALSGSIPKSLL